MIGHTLFGYFLRRYLMMALQVVVAIVVVAYLVDFTEFARRAGNSPEYTIGRGLYLSAMRMPMIVMLIWPFVALLAAMGALLALNRRYELVVARSAGISAWQFLAPLAAGAFMVGVAAIGIVNPLSAWSMSQVSEIESTFRGWTPTQSDELAIPWLVQDEADGKTIIGASRTARRGLLLGDAVFLRLDGDGNLFERIDARSASLDRGAWLLEDATRSTGSGDSEKIASLRLASTLSPEFIEQRVSDPNVVSIYELPGIIQVARSLGLNPNRFAMHFHSLIALPALMVAMTLIAATVSLRFARMGQSMTVIVGGILSGFLLYVALVVFTAFGNQGFVPPVIAAWVPVLAAMFTGVSFLLHKEDG